MSQAECARAAEVSEPAWNVIEKARQVRYRLATLRGVSEALGWTVDSIDLILEGGEPTLLGIRNRRGATAKGISGSRIERLDGE